MNYISSGVNNQVMLHCMSSFWGEQPSGVHERLPLSSPRRNRIQLDMSKTEVITVICLSGVEKPKQHHATGYMQTSSYWYNNVLCFRSRHTKSFAWTLPPHSTATKHHSAIQVNTNRCPETWPFRPIYPLNGSFFQWDCAWRSEKTHHAQDWCQNSCTAVRKDTPCTSAISELFTLRVCRCRRRCGGRCLGSLLGGETCINLASLHCSMLPLWVIELTFIAQTEVQPSVQLAAAGLYLFPAAMFSQNLQHKSRFVDIKMPT